MQEHRLKRTQFPRSPTDFQSAPTEKEKNGTAWKVKIPESFLAALRSIAKRIGDSDLVPQPTTHSLILKAISNYIQLCKEAQTQTQSQTQSQSPIASPDPAPPKALAATAGRRAN